jgi:hypothetical protein
MMVTLDTTGGTVSGTMQVVGGNVTSTINSPVPEPTSMLLMGAGLLALAAARCRRIDCSLTAAFRSPAGLSAEGTQAGTVPVRNRCGGGPNPGIRAGSPHVGVAGGKRVIDARAVRRRRGGTTWAPRFSRRRADPKLRTNGNRPPAPIVRHAKLASGRRALAHASARRGNAAHRARRREA